MSKILVTGGAGFIGSNFVRLLLERTTHAVVNFDALTYAGNLENLAGLEKEPRYTFVRGDIRDAAAVRAVFETHAPDVVAHFAAESHVDRSVLDATAFVATNVVGTQVLLDASRAAGVKRFLHVSTDEVYGSLGATGRFREDSPLQPNSPYSASKTGSDLLVRAAFHTHGFAAIVTRCSNNYGPYQFPEKLIPLMIANALEGKPLPVYGDGKNVRDWIHVRDHCEALLRVIEKGRPGEVYNIGGDSERENLHVVRQILALAGRGEELIRYVTDRPGHDRRYAIDSGKMRAELGWTPSVRFEDGLAQTFRWYVDNRTWWERVRSGAYREYYERWYGQRR
ncbi:MAG: dTDP-glucose 4,6-dehydratase [Planctomycetes bacterium]|nr:dTDP-glucose 4,6-dehydratase [Planctomycetota bacterium]